MARQRGALPSGSTWSPATGKRTIGNQPASFSVILQCRNTGARSRKGTRHGPIRVARQVSSPPPLEFEGELDEKELFDRAMEGGRPLPGQQRLVRPAARRGRLEPVNPSDLMEEALEGVKEFEWPFAPGYTEGGDLQWNRRLLRRLRKGRFTVQAELDLHGYTQREARRELHRFLEECVGRGLTCVRIIHGQGHHSPNQTPVPQEAPS